MESCCRTCSRSDNFLSISLDAISENNGEPVYLMIIYCTQLQLSNRDNFPQQICYDCMARLDAAFNFWKQSRQADISLQQQQLMLNSTEDETVATTTTIAPDILDEQTQQQTPPDDERNFQVEECKFNAQTQVIEIDEDGDCDSEVQAITGETPLQATSAGEHEVDDEALRHQRYIIDSEAESELEEEEQEPEPEPVRVAKSTSKPTFKIKINRTKKSKFVKTGRFKCQPCKQTFPTNSLLRHHLSMHENTCQHCSKIFSTIFALNRHLSSSCSVLKNVNYSAYCEHCNRGFTNPKAIKKHQDRSCPVLHPDGSTYINSVSCKYCKRGFSSNQNMLRHQRKACPILKRPPNQPASSVHVPKLCPYCRKRFNSSKEIKRHIRHCLKRRPTTPAPPTEEIDSPNYEVHPSELLDCVMKQEQDEVLGS